MRLGCTYAFNFYFIWFIRERDGKCCFSRWCWASITRTEQYRMITQSRKRTLSIENLESRFNLSTLGTSIIPKVQTVSPSYSTYRSTYIPTQKSALKLASTATTVKKTMPAAAIATKTATKVSAAATTADTTSQSLMFGDTSIGAGTTSVGLTSYSVMNGAKIEYVNGSPDIGYMSNSGADIEYSLNVATAGAYTLNLGVASPYNSSFTASVNGGVQANFSFNSTNDWQKYTTTSQRVTLNAGTNVLKISPTNGSVFNINAISLSQASTTGASKVTTVGNSASVPVSNYSAISNCQLETQWNGVQDIGCVSPWGSYVEYTLNVQSAGNYNVGINTSAPTWSSADLSVNGAKQASYAFNQTGGWASFNNTTTHQVYLPAGTVTLRLASTGGTQYNIGGINVAAVGSTTTTSNNATTTPAASPTSVGNATTSVPVTSYSAISNSQLEYVNGSPDIGYVSPSGSYVEYTLNVQTAGNYSVGLGMAAPSTASATVSVNGSSGGTYTVSPTGGWQNYKTVANTMYLPSGTVKLRVSSTPGTTYNLNGIAVSPSSSTTVTTPTTPITPTTPTTPSTPTTTTNNGSGFDASVNTQWMTSFNQLNIVAGSKSDSIVVSQSGSTIYVNVNGVTNSYTGSYGNIVVKAGSGGDNITVDGSVNVATLLYGGSGNDTLKNYTSGNATIVSIGGGYDTLAGNGKNTAFWADSGDGVNASGTEYAIGGVHSVSSFWGGVSTQLQGQNLSDPAGTGATTRIANASFWGTGPTVSDINQGQVSDCFFLGSVQTLANNNPSALRQMAVDLGDGTYAVQFKRGGATTYVRVDGDLPSNGYYANGLMYEHPGASGDIWAAVMEKAYAEYRTGAWNYSSLNNGYFGSVFSDLGVGYSAFGSGGANFNNIVNALNSGKGVTIGTNSGIVGGAPLIGYHTYTVTSAWNSGGTQYVQLRNPWGYDGTGNDGNSGDALVTMTLGQLNQNLQAGAILA